MCHCKVFEVSTPVEGEPLVTQKCKDCGKETKLPGTIYDVLRFMQEDKKYRMDVNHIMTYHSKELD